MTDSDRRGGTGTLLKPEHRTQKPPLYKVLLHNDDFTPRHFVVEVLRRFFGKSETSAIQIMMTAHTNGHSVVGVYSHEVAEMKAFRANDYAVEQGYPLRFSVDKE